MSESNAKLKEYVLKMRYFETYVERNPVSALIMEIIKRIGYMEHLSKIAKDKEELDDRVGNLLDLTRKAEEFESGNHETGLRQLGAFLDEISLYTSSDEKVPEDCVQLMTIHSSKGLEFDTVYVIGVDEGIIPRISESDLDEERRVLYVAVTRAKKNLTVSSSDECNIFGQRTRTGPSRFFREI